MIARQFDGMAQLVHFRVNRSSIRALCGVYSRAPTFH
jgi:hypothetical protein